jgi:hypothetical protein
MNIFKKAIFGVSVNLVFWSILIWPSIGFTDSYEYRLRYGAAISTPQLLSAYGGFAFCTTAPGQICPTTTIDLGLNGGKLNAGLISFAESGYGELNVSFLRTWNNIAGLTGGDSNYVGLAAAAHILLVAVQVGVFDKVSHGEGEGRRVLYTLGASFGF